jgi:hypothetical protein
MGRRAKPIRLHLEPLEPRDVPSFLPPLVYRAAHELQDVTTADVNGDGRLDVVAAGGDGVSVLLGNGDGTLQPPVRYAAGAEAYGVRLTDLNGDGRPDIVTANYSPYRTVSVLLNKGGGKFGHPQSYAAGGSGYKVAVGDVNGDGIPDVAVPDYTGSYLWVWYGNGDGTLGPKQTIVVQGLSEGVDVTDLDHDGRGDVSVDMESGPLAVAYANGIVATYQAGGDWGHTAADVNGDGWPDLVVGRWDSPSVSVLLNRGDGTFKPRTDFPAGKGGTFPVVADFNGDHKPDIAATHLTGSDSVCVLLGNGDGTFQPPLTFTGGPVAVTSAAGDLNQDGHPDLIVAHTDGTLTVLLNDGNWTAPVPPPGPGRATEPLAAPPAEAGRSAILSPARVQTGDDDAAVPAKATPAAVATLPRVAGAAPDTPEAFPVLQEPLA